MKINCLDETKTIPLEFSFIRGSPECVTGRKALGTLNSAIQSTVSAPKMRSDVDDLNIKLVPFDDAKLSHVENIFI